MFYIILQLILLMGHEKVLYRQNGYVYINIIKCTKCVLIIKIENIIKLLNSLYQRFISTSRP